MSKKTRSQRRRERANRQPQNTEVTSQHQRGEPSPDPEPSVEVDGQATEPDPDPINIDDVVETLHYGDVACVLTCGEENRLQVFPSTAIANAAEQAACAYVVQLGRFPSHPITAECWTNAGHYGPFDIELTLQADALGLRQGE